MLALLLIALKIFIDNNVIIDASSTEDILKKDMQSLVNLYNSILIEKKNFNTDQRSLNDAQIKIAFYYYKQLCYLIFEYSESETQEFREHFDKMKEEYKKMISESEFTVCEFYKMFVRINFDKILQKSEQWNLFIRKKTRYIFWMDNQWQEKTKTFLENLNWQSNESCSKEERKKLQEYLTKDSHNNYVANFTSLKWLMAVSKEFVKNFENKSEDEFIKIKQRIFFLTGPIGFDRLEMTRMYFMKIGIPIPEYTNSCLISYLSGMENAKIYYHQRMSISFLTKRFFIFRQSLVNKKQEIEKKLDIMAKKEKRISEKVHENLKLKLEKFDRISDIIKKLLISVGDLNDNEEFIMKAKAFLEQTLYILLKCFEFSANGEYIISDESIARMSEEYLRKFYDISDNGEKKIKSDKSFAAMNAENLLEKTSKMELKSMEKEILPTFYLIEIDKLLADADKELQNILKNFSSIYTLASLIGGIENLYSMTEMTRICIIRYLSGDLEGTKFELRLSLSYFLNSFNRFRINFSGTVLKEKLNNIYEQIVDVKLVQLNDVEHTLEKEMEELKEAICILLKFFETKTTHQAEYFPTVSEEKVNSISYEQAMQCTTAESKDILERQRFMLQSHHYQSMEKLLSVGNEELENILKYKDGAIYLLKELIGSDNLLELWNNYREKMRDRTYFFKKLDEIRESFEIFMTTQDEHNRQLNKTKLKIFALMRWLDITLKGHTPKFNPNFSGILSSWHILFRQLLDELTVHPNHVNNIEIQCTIRGGYFAKFVQDWKDKTRDEQLIRDEYDNIYDKIQNSINETNGVVLFNG